MALVALSLGSNIQPERNLLLAVAMLRGAGRLVAVSRVHETEPVGGVGQPRFLNAAVLLETALGASEFKERVGAGIERALGRARDPADRNAPRTIDVDISLWLADETEAPGPPPAADISRQAHLAAPLAELVPDLRLMGAERSLAEIAAELVARGPAPTLRPDVDLRAAAGLA